MNFLKAVLISNLSDADPVSHQVDSAQRYNDIDIVPHLYAITI